MELLSRPKADIYTRPGEYPALRQRLRALTAGLEIPSLVAYAFDPRTRLLPYYFTSHHMAPAGARAVGAALFDSGLPHTRIVLQQWTPNVRPSTARLEHRPIELLLVSSMQIHAAYAYNLIQDACRMDGRRPLIIAGGPKAIYEPQDLFAIRGDARVNADVVVTGEEFVLMQLLEVLLDYRGRNGSLLEAFRAARRDAALDDIPGLVYREHEACDAPLRNTGVQRLVRDLDEMPHPLIGFKLLERPHRGVTLKSQPLSEKVVRWRSRIGSLTLSYGCKFNCDYCPIPAYNQRTYRHKSGERIADEMKQLREQLGIRYFFGTDDNFFNNRPAVEQMFQVMRRTQINGKPLRKQVRWGTEATEFDTWKNRDLIKDARASGMRAIWFGIEDMTATLIKKGQSVNKTAELFNMLNRIGITPRPMLMHHDAQPLYSRTGLYGLLNQVRYLQKVGATSLQVTVLTPAVGTRSYEPTFEKNLVFDQVSGRRVDEWQFDGNHVVASAHRKPWRVQLNLLAAYALFYNPIRLLCELIRPKNSLFLAGTFCQVTGMYSLAHTLVHSLKWAFRLWRGPIVRRRWSAERAFPPALVPRPMLRSSQKPLAGVSRAAPELAQPVLAETGV
ncbi:MAG TPA: radical SAM protein [Phycisphaerae bacterium]|jgi:radical SAM superfamily enzyme YgiQ (UPF0313 family)